MKHRILALLLAMTMMLQLVPAAFADETGDPGLLNQPGEEEQEPALMTASSFSAADYTVFINGKLARDLKVAYGEVLDFELRTENRADADVVEGAKFYYSADVVPGTETDVDWDQFTNGERCLLEPGKRYYLNYVATAENDGGGSTIWDFDDNNIYQGSFSITVTEGALDAPQNLNWNGTEMSWDAVTTASNGYSNGVSGVVDSYQVTVYRDGVQVQQCNDVADTFYDLTGDGFLAGEEALGSGKYTFRVKAVADPASGCYTDSAMSGSSGAFTVPRVTVKGDSGVETVTSATAVLLPGVEGFNQTNISVTPKEGYTFAGWTADAGGVMFGDGSALSTTVTLDAGYSGSAALTIRAETSEGTPPVITSFTADDGQLVGKASDNDGIAGYAFTTEADASRVTSWKPAGTAADDVSEFYFTPNDAGEYYFHVKDRSGNTATAKAPVSVTEVRLGNYDNNGATVRKYVVGSVSGEDPYTLPVPTCAGYDFKGWFDGESNQVTEITAHDVEGGYTLTARWETQSIDDLSISPYAAEYDGQTHTLSAEISGVTGTLEYQWWKLDEGGEYQKIENQTAKLTVKDVADSGSYRVEITMKDAQGTVIAQRNPVDTTVNITPKPLTIRAKNCTVSYGAPVPTYKLIYDSFAEGEDASVLTGTQTVSCAYTQGDPVDTYPITLSDFGAANYTITLENGQLTVNKKSELTAYLKDGSTYGYTGGAIEPVVVVKDGEAELTEGTDYTVAYSDNINAGTGSVTVTYTGEKYSGGTTLYFTITQQALPATTVTINSWTYDGQAHGASLSDTAPDGRVTYHYARKGAEKSDSSAWSTDCPVNAGEYQAYASITGMTNYEDYETEAVEFTVSKRTVIIKASDATFVYDGYSHVCPEYEFLSAEDGNEGFVDGEGFSFVKTSGSITNVEESPQYNTIISYGLSASTLPDNYEIITNAPECVGQLTVTPLELTVPSGAGWSDTAPGTATWVAVAKNGLTVKYQLQLFAVDGQGGKTPVSGIIETSETSCNFADTIRTYAQAHGAYSYGFTIRTIPAGGENLTNYRECAFSDDLKGSLHTAEVSVAKYDAATEALREPTINGGPASIIMLEGESAEIAVTANPGYYFEDLIWLPNPFDAGLTVGGIRKEENADGTKSSTATLTAKLTRSLESAVVYAKVANESPEVVSFAGANSANFGFVTLSFTARDSKDLKAWMLSANGDTPPAAEDSGWADFVGTDGKDGTASVQVTEPGTYYLYVKDEAGNVVRGSQSQSVYSIRFNGGTGTAVGGGLPTMLKAQNTTVPLPAVEGDPGYTNEGHDFLHWRGATGIYPDQTGYSVNASDELTAVWTGQTFQYTVKYYQMDREGNYSETPVKTDTFTDLFGTTVLPQDAGEVPLGFSLDEEKSHSITITGEGLVMEVYYRRNQYTLTYSYMDVDGTEKSLPVETYYYGEDLTVQPIPVAAGYDFVGWTFDKTGTAPATMPAEDIRATGYFRARETGYYICYFLQDLNEAKTGAGSTYTMLASMNQVFSVKQGDPIRVSAATLETIKGYTFAGASVTVEMVGEGVFPSAPQMEVNTTAAAGTQMYINCYFNRNEYNIILNVWQGEVGVGEPTYSQTWPYVYEAKVDDTINYAHYEESAWPHDDGYVLADYVNWSHGGTVAPAVMPAGDVTVTRQFVSETIANYQVEVYLQGANGLYSNSPSQKFTYSNNIGKMVTLGGSEINTVNYNNFSNSIPNFSAYHMDEAQGNILSGYVSDLTGEEGGLTLKIYFARDTVTATIRYYYHDGSMASKKLMATVTKSGIWGSSYDCEALALFYPIEGGSWKEPDRVSNYTQYERVDGSNPDLYDFRNNNYVVSYSGYYWLDDGGHWPSGTYDTVDSLTDGAEHISIFGCTGESRVDVTYTRTNTAKQYYLDAGYNAVNLTGTDEFVPLTADYGGGEYKIRIANEAFFYQDAAYVVDTSGAYADYPGLAYYNKNSDNADATSGKFDYDTESGVLKLGFQKITIGTKTYYLNTDEGYIYIADPYNRFFVGNFTSYSYPTDEIGYSDVTDYLTAYKAAHPGDPYAQGADVYNRGWGRTSVYFGDQQVEYRLTITMRSGDTYRLRYEMGGTACLNDGHVYADGFVIPLADIGCVHGTFPAQPGYQIVWYTDSACTERVTSPITMNSDQTVYGKYEKVTLTYTTYAYFELANPAVIGGRTYSYITEDDLNDPAVAGVVEPAEPIVDANGVTTVTYSYNGAVVMVKKVIPVESFTQVNMNTEDLAYPLDGLHYDETNPENRIKGYCQTAPITLRAYFARTSYQLTVDMNWPNLPDSVETTLYRNGQQVTLTDPVLEGYAFMGWDWYKNGADWTENVPTSHNAAFAMPEASVKAVATWSAANYIQTITHYFQNVDGLYNMAALAAMQADGSTAATVWYDSTEYPNGKHYVNGGVSFVTGDQTWYFAGAEGQDGVYTADSSALIAVVQSFYVAQDMNCEVTPLTVSGYGFDHGSLIYKGSKTELNVPGSYTARAGTQLEYYYTRGTVTITLSAFTSGGTPSTATLTGAGTYPSGKTVRLTADVLRGYSFAGWYRAEDVLDGEGALKAEWNSEAKVGSTASMTVQANSSAHYVAVLSPTAVDVPTLMVRGKDYLEFGYAQDPENAVTVSAVFAEGSSSYVQSYQWYKNDAIIEGATSATYLIPTGWNAGRYQLTCKVTVGRRDNDQVQIYTTDPHTLTVGKKPITVSTVDYEGVYDKNAHTFDITVDEPEGAEKYKIYYSTTELTEANYEAEGTLVQPSYTNVNVKDGSRIPHTVYYYVRSLDGNYADVSGSAQVNITAQPVTLSAGTAVYSKTYDGSDTVKGTVQEVDSDLGKLVRQEGVYTIHGLLSGDDNAYIIDANARFNDKHVSGANAITLSNLKLCLAGNTTENFNYEFASTYTIQLSGYITPLKLTIGWTGDTAGTPITLVYDGTARTPQAAITNRDQIPEDERGNLTLAVSGKQTYVGTDYDAVAKLVVGGGSRESDYVAVGSTTKYNIDRRPITVVPVGEMMVVYDGLEHGLAVDTANRSITAGSLAVGHSLTAETSGTGKNAGSHLIRAVDVVIRDANGTNVTGNYKVTTPEVTLTIQRRPVQATATGTYVKSYDGTTGVDSDIVNYVRFDPVTGSEDKSGVLEGDTVELESYTVAYDQAAVSSDNPVHMTGMTLTNSNYTLESSTLDIPGKITGAIITAVAKQKETVYGSASVDFEVEFRLQNGESAESALSGLESVTYTIYRAGEAESAFAYSSSTPVDTYYIKLNLAGVIVTGSNYDHTVEVVQDMTAPNQTLTVKKRPVAVGLTAYDNTTPVTKEYDGNTSVTAGTEEIGKHYEFTAVIGQSESGIMSGDEGSVSLSYGAVYNEKDAGSRTVTLSGLSLTGAKSGNYQMVTESLNLNGKITKKPLTVKAENKEVTYGDAAPAYTVAYDDFVSGDNAGNSINGTAAFDCAYDSGVSGKREVRPDGYEITIQTGYLSSNNYELDLKPGKLTVKPAKLTVTTRFGESAEASKTITYGDPIPKLDYQVEGFQYEENGSVITENTPVTYTCGGLPVATNDPTVPNFPEGTYGITPVATGLSAANYEFDSAPGYLTVGKRTGNQLIISGIQIDKRVYDGTTNVYAGQYILSGVTIDGLQPADQSLVMANPAAYLTISGGTYDSADAGDSHTVSNLTITLGDYLAARYVLDDEHSQHEATGTITKRPVTITAVNPATDKKVPYGSAAPAYSYETEGLVDGEPISGVTYTCGYSGVSPYSQVDDYTVEIAEVNWGVVNKNNYALTTIPDTLHVVQNQLASPNPVWSTEDSTPGVVNWAEVPGIGDVAVKEYQVELYKDDSPVAGSLVTTTARTCDYTTQMRNLGAGAYTVKVTAIASTDSNEGHKNVANSAPGTSAPRHAALVRFVFQAGTPGRTETITINGGSTGVVMFPGDSAALSAELENTTGYVVSSVTSSNAAVTVDKTSDNMDGGTRKIYTSTASMTGDPGSAADITITLTTAARAATLNVTLVKTNNDNTCYGYGESQRPVVTATAVPVDDTIGTGQYTYKFAWKAYTGLDSISWDDNVVGSNISTYTVPLGYSANDNERYYKVQCTVTATRTDNGKTIKSATQTVYIQINRAAFTVTAAQEGWTYGDLRKTPVLTYDPPGAAPGGEDVTYWYVPADTYDADHATTAWNTAVPQDVGDYYVKAMVAQRTNYEAKESAPVRFSINQATLEKPVITGMDAVSGKASYGQLNWTWNSPIYENGSNLSNYVTAQSYEVKLYKDGVLQKTYEPTANKTLNILDDIQTSGDYRVTVTAISSNARNCADSPESDYYDIHVGAAVGSTTSKVYDGTPVTLTASGGGSCQWYKNGQLIPGANGSTYSPKHVADSGSYNCVVTSGSQITYTPYVKVAITRRPVTLTSASDSKTYDGTPLTNSNVVVGGSGFAGGEGVQYYDVTGTQTVVGSSDNTFSYTLKDNTNAGDYDGDYDINTVYGTLEVTGKSLGSGAEYAANITVADIPSETYNGFAHTPAPEVKYGIVLLEAGEGKDYTYSYSTNNTDAGTVTITITGQGNYSGSITKTFQITPATLTVTTDRADKEYDGTPLTASGSIGGFVPGETATFTTTGTQTLVGSSTNTYTLTFNQTAKESNYTISENLGMLEVKNRTTPYEITVVSKSSTVTYSGTEQSVSGFTTSLTFTVDGVEGYTVEGLTAEGKGTNAGPYTNIITGTAIVKDSGGNDVTAQFTVHQTEGTLTINKAPLTVTTPDAGKVYDSTALTAEGSISGFVSGETATFVTTGTQTAVGSSINTYTLTFDGTAQEGNYIISSVTLGTLTVTQSTAEITVTTTGGSFTYDGAAHGATVAVTGVPTGYTLATAASSATATHVAEGTVSATADQLVIRNAQGEDVTSALNIRYVNGTIQIIPAPLTVTTPDAGKVYDGTPLTAEGSISGFVNGETATFVTTGTQTAVDSSTNTYTLTFDQSARETDYEVTANLGTLTVTQSTAEITATTTGGTFTYDGAAHGATVAVTGVPTGYTLATAASSATATHVAEGTVSATADQLVIRNAQGEDVTSALNIRYVNGTIQITPAPLTVTTPDAGKVYDSTALTAEGSISGFVNGETATFVTTGTQTAVGSSTNTYTLTFDQSARETDYEVTTNLGTLTVTQSTAEITVTTTGGTFTYDGEAHGATVEVTGVPTGYTVATAASSATATHVAEGTVPATADRLVIRNAQGEDVTSELRITYVDGTITITPAPLTVTTPDASKVYDGTPLTAVGTVSGLMSGETVTIRAAGSRLNRGESSNTYSLVWDGMAVETDYAVTSENLGTLTVTPRSLGSGASYAAGISVADIPAMDYRHEACQPEPAVTDDGLAFGAGAVLVKGTDFTYSLYENNFNAGTATVTITGTGNYTGSITKTFTINSLTVIRPDVDRGKVSLIVETPDEEGRSVSARVVNDLEIINACLTDEEKWRIQNTPDRVQLRLTISRIEEDEVVLSEREIVEQYLEENQGTFLGAYLDIKLDKSWDNWVTWENIPETAVDVQIVIDIPEDILAANRTFTIYRVHQYFEDSEVQYRKTLLNDLDTENDTFTTNTRYFSTYALLYRQTAAGGGGGSGAGGAAEESGPTSAWETGVADYLNCEDHVDYIHGYKDGTIGPNRNITRAEVAMMFYRLLRDPYVSGGKYFSDVEEDAWYVEAVSTLSALGIIEGYRDGSFGPDKSITRAEFTAIAVRFSKMEQGSSNFPDVPETYWARKYVDVSVNYGWVLGFKDGTFRPEAKITRAEVATIINRMMSRSADVGYVDRNFQNLRQFTDLQDSSVWYFYAMVEASNRHDYAFKDGGEIWK